MAKKITKVIAALGVVAGLGIAALPLSSYAEDVDVIVEILPTIGTVEPGCDEVDTDGGAGEEIDGECGIAGSSNTGIKISIKDKDTVLNLVHTNGTDTIAPIAATTPLANFTFTNGIFGWGYNFASSATGLTVVSGFDTNYRAITASDVMVASSIVPVTMTSSNTKFNFRAVTPATQVPGIYKDIVTITVAVNE
jgi:hypothetical protein